MASGVVAAVGAVGRFRKELHKQTQTAICRKFEGTDLQTALSYWMDTLDAPVSYHTHGNVLMDLESKGSTTSSTSEIHGKLKGEMSLVPTKLWTMT